MRGILKPLLRAVPVVAIVGAQLVAAGNPANATEGYMQNAFGARSKALAGAGAASSTDATAASLNPAGLVNVPDQIAGSVSLFHMDGGTSSSGSGGINAPGRVDNDPGLLAIPNIAASWHVNWGLADVVALTAYGNGGVNTNYKDVANPNCGGASGLFCGGRLGVKHDQTFLSVAFAKQVTSNFSVGFAPIVARQTMNVVGLSLFSALGLSSDPANMTNRGTDESWGYGARAGIEWKITPHVTFGLAGNTRIEMQNFDRYQGLFAQHASADIAPTLQAGLAFAVKPNVTLMFDYKHIWYDSIAAVNNPASNPLPFGTDTGPGFGLQPLDVYKVALEWRATKEATLRAGYSYNTSPYKSSDTDFNILTLGTIQHHITGGLNYALTDKLDIELALMYAPRSSLAGLEFLNPNRNVEITNSQVEFTVGAVYRFGHQAALDPLK